MNKNLKFKIKNWQEGQVAIVVLLISAVVMTIGLSVSKRTVTETNIDTNDEQLKQAFNTAESGLEYYLKTQSTGFTASDGSQAKITASNLGGGSNKLDFESLTLNNNSIFFWLASHLADGSIDYGNYYNGTALSICLGTGFAGGLKVDYFYRDAGNIYKVWRQGYYVGASSPVNNFVSKTLSNKCFDIENTIPLAGGTRVPLLIVVRPLGMGANISLMGNSNFPVQGQVLTSMGTVGPADHEISQVVNILNQYKVPTFMLDAVTASQVLSN